MTRLNIVIKYIFMYSLFEVVPTKIQAVVDGQETSFLVGSQKSMEFNSEHSKKNHTY